MPGRPRLCARLPHPYMRTCENSISCLSPLSQSPVSRLALFRLTSHSPVFLCSYSNLRYRKHNFKVFTLLLDLLSLLFSFANPSSLQVILKVLGNKLGLDLRFLLLLLHLSTSQTTQTNRQLSPFSLFSLAISAIPQFFSTSLLASAALTPIHNDSIESSISNSTLDSQILNDPLLSHNP